MDYPRYCSHRKKTTMTKEWVRYKVNSAVDSGELEKPQHCQYCGRPISADRLQGHHLEYNEDSPYSVVWLCATCHTSMRYANRDLNDIAAVLMSYEPDDNTFD